jgi:hypothetical protein
MREQVIQNLSQVAPPGEQFISCIHTETGPSPWLNILFEEVPFLTLIVQMMRKYYFITLTNNHIVVNKAGRMTNRPKEVVVAIPLQAAPFSRIKKGKIWSRLYFQFPGESAPTRMNFHRIWNADVDRFIAMFPNAIDGAEGGQQQAIPAQQQYGQQGQHPQQQYQNQHPQQQHQNQHPQQQYGQQGQHPQQQYQNQHPQQQHQNQHPQQQYGQQGQHPQQQYQSQHPQQQHQDQYQQQYGQQQGRPPQQQYPSR